MGRLVQLLHSRKLYSTCTGLPLLGLANPQVFISAARHFSTSRLAALDRLLLTRTWMTSPLAVMNHLTRMLWAALRVFLSASPMQRFQRDALLAMMLLMNVELVR